MAKAIVVYYSYSGNTHKVSGLLKDELSGASYQTELLRLKPLDESSSFLGQCKRSFLKKEASLGNNLTFDVSGYDLVALGTPVWAFGMAPAMRTYFNKCSGLTGKKVVIFVTCGSGAGVGKCVKEMISISQAKGASDTRSFIISQSRLSDEEKVTEQIRESLKEWL